MNPACHDFREHLADALSGVQDLTALAWREHLLGCADCRALLEAEEALETLLASLPEPALPPALAERLLARLRPERGGELLAEQALDDLLELDRIGELEVPPNLASDVLAGLRTERRASSAEERALDRLLDRAPSLEPPADLADRVLSGLEAHRGRRRPTPIPSSPTGPVQPGLAGPGGRAFTWPRALAAAAALTAFAWAAWMVRAARDEGTGGSGSDETMVAVVDDVPVGIEPVGVEDEVPVELLASLDLLESWEYLAEDDLDLALAALDEVDLLILELEAEGS